MSWWKNRRKTYKITFKKVGDNFKQGSCFWNTSWQEIADSSVIATVFEIADTLNIEVISIDMQNSLRTSTIKIKCTAENKIEFIKYFTEVLNDKIEDITF